MPRHTVTRPISGEAECSVELPEGATKQQIWEAAAEKDDWQGSWGFDEDERRGRYAEIDGEAWDPDTGTGPWDEEE